MPNFKHCWLLFPFICFVTTLQAQSTFSNLEPFYINYTTDDGLPSSECHHTIQDRKGYIWIATDNGVSRFDGYGFRNFSADDGLKNNVVFYLQEDRDGRIWILTMSGNLYYYDYATDRVHGYEHNDKVQEYRGEYAWAGPFYVDSLGTVYVGLKNLGVLKINKDASSKLYQTDEISAMIILEVEDFLVYSIIGPKVSQQKEYINNYLSMNIRPPLEFYRNDSLTNRLYFSRMENSNDNLILSRLKGGSFFNKKLKKNGFFFQNNVFNALIDIDFQYIRRKNLFRVSSEKAILELENEHLLIGESTPGGIYEMESTAAFIEGKKELSKFLAGKYISNLQIDKQDGMWVTTVKNGLFYLPNYKNKIISHEIGLPSDNITSFHFKDKSNLIFGQGTRAVYELDFFSKNFSEFPKYPSSGTIKKIYKDEKGVVWVASGSMNWFDNGEWHTINKGLWMNEFLIIDFGQSFNVSKNKQYIWSWGATSFSKIDINKKIVEFDARYINIRESFNTVYEDFLGKVWLGTHHGLYEFKDSTMVPQNTHPAFKTRIEDIRQMQDSTLVIGTKGAGLIFWKDKNTIQLTRRDGLTSNMIENVYVDSLQGIWVGTSEGLNLIKFDKKNVPFIKQYTKKHGLPSNEINQVEVYGDDIWVATTKGLIKLPAMETDTLATPPIIEKILVNGKPLNNFTDQKVNLKSEQNSLQIEFLTIDYQQHGDINYRYRLLPNQEKWNYSQNRKLDFSALNDNSYRLEIQSQNRDGYWSPSTVFAFVILPPFWKTWWFILGMILLGAAILSFWVKRIQKEADLVRKMAEAEQFALRSQMNPHFIFNCLAAIQGFVSTGEKDKAIRYLSRFSKLIRTSLLFMDKQKITLEEEITMLTNYLELEKMRHGEKFNYQLEVADQLDLEETEIPPLMVQPFVENSILHAFVDKKSGGLLTVKYQMQHDRFKVIIQDNGIGLTESHKRKNRLANAHKSVGTKIIARRLELKGKQAENGLLMTEIKDQNGRVKGTKVVIDFGEIALI